MYLTPSHSPIRRRFATAAIATMTVVALSTGAAVAATPTEQPSVQGSTLYTQPDASSNLSSQSSQHSPYVVATSVLGGILAVAVPVALIIAAVNYFKPGALAFLQR